MERMYSSYQLIKEERDYYTHLKIDKVFRLIKENKLLYISTSKRDFNLLKF